MSKYKIGTGKDLAEMLMRVGIGNQVSFALHFEKCGDEIIECSIEGWFGATILNLFDGYCLLAGQMGMGNWYAYDVAGIAGIPQIAYVENAAKSLLDYEFLIEPDVGICIEMFSDNQLEEIWTDLDNIPFDEADVPGDMILAEDWRGFPKGTDRLEIWQFFDKHHSKGVAFLLYGESH